MIDPTSVAPGTWFASGYAVVLLTVAYGIDLMSHRAARNVESHRTAGFAYHADHDAWVCPEDQWLWPQSFDPDNRVMRYRGSPTICNSCPVKDTCTSSAGGREIQRQVDPWPASESARFHRGLACTVAVLASAWPLVSAFAAPTPTQSWALVGVALLVALGSLPLWSHLRRTSVDPEGVLVRTSDDNVADRAETAQQQLSRRTAYRSDRQLPRRTAYRSDRQLPAVGGTAHRSDRQLPAVGGTAPDRGRSR